MAEPLGFCSDCPSPHQLDCGAWALWHPQHGFGQYVHVQSHMEDAVADRKAQIELEADELWRVVPVRVSRVDHT